MISSENTFKSLFDLLKAFPDDKACIKKLEGLIWKDAIVSPFDPTSEVYVCKNGKYKCRSTNKYFNVLTGTIFEGTKISMQKWFMAIYIETSHKKGISSHQLGRDIEVTQKTAWFMLSKIRYALQHKSFARQMEGTIEADETYIGGKYKNKHKSKKKEGAQGRSVVDKTPVFGLIERDEHTVVERPHKVIKGKTVKEKVVTKEKKVVCQVVKDTQAGTIQPIIKEAVRFESKIMTDEWWAYNGLSRNYYHGVVMHKAKQYVDGDIYTNTLEGFWGLLKRGINGIHHWVSRKHLQKYVDGCVFRYNTRKESSAVRFETYLSNVIKMGITQRELIS